jgi:hypothetical protein
LASCCCCCCHCLQLIRKSPLFNELFAPNESLRITKVFNMPLNSMTLDKQIIKVAYDGADKNEVTD